MKKESASKKPATFRVAAALIAVSLTAGATLAACSAASPPEAVAEATTAPTDSAANVPVAQEDTPKPAGNVVTTKHGSYLQAPPPTITYNPGIVDPPAYNSFTPEEIASGTQFIADFIARQGIDSPLNGGGQSVEDFFAENKDLISPDYFQELLDDTKAGKPFVMNEKWQEKFNGAYQYIYDANTPRILDLSMTPTVIWALQQKDEAGNPGTLGVEFKTSYRMKVIPGVGGTGTGDQISKGQMTYSATKSPAGKWQIDGYDHDMKTTEG